MVIITMFGVIRYDFYDVRIAGHIIIIIIIINIFIQETFKSVQTVFH